jgi:hypothetical protein
MKILLMFVVLIVSAAFVAAEATPEGTTPIVPGENGHKFAGHSKCRTCHKKATIGNQYGAWQDSRHARAFETLASEQASKWGAERGVENPQTDERCLKCHVTAFGIADSLRAKTFARTVNDGVQCESCHGAGYDYKKKKVMADHEAAVEMGLLDPTEQVCRVCHNSESPAWDETTVFDYEKAIELIAHPIPEGYTTTEQ